MLPSAYSLDRLISPECGGTLVPHWPAATLLSRQDGLISQEYKILVAYSIHRNLLSGFIGVTDLFEQRSLCCSSIPFCVLISMLHKQAAFRSIFQKRRLSYITPETQPACFAATFP